MKVLLISPVEGVDPAGGDVTYTQSLLVRPPTNVTYVTYDQALRDGTLIEHGRREAFGRAWKDGSGRVRETFLLGACRLAGMMRRGGMMSWEPFRHFTVQPDTYDLVHVHVFSVGFESFDCPVLMSCGGPMDWLYRDARGYSALRVSIIKLFESALARGTGVNRAFSHAPQVSAVLTYTGLAKEKIRCARRGSGPQISVVPTFVESAPCRPLSGNPRRIGFVGRNFHHKGGDLAVEAYQRIRERRNDVELLVLSGDGSLPPEIKADPNVRVLQRVPRAQLLGDILPALDVLVYPTRYDYLPCYTLLEAMARGVPIAGSDYRSMRDVLAGKAGVVSPPEDVSNLAFNIEFLLDPENNENFSLGAREHFMANYSGDAVLPQLQRIYESLVEDSSLSLTKNRKMVSA